MTEQTPRRSRRWIGCLALAAVFFVTVVAVPPLWFVAHLGGEPGPPRWTEADLPAPPPDDQNAWRVMGPAVEGAPEEVGELTDDLPLAERRAAFEREREHLGWRAPPLAGREALVEWSARPHFAFTCPRAIEVDCDVMPAVSAFRMAWAVCAWHAARGQWGPALETLGSVLSLVVDGLRYADRILDAALLGLVLEEGVRLAELLVDRARASGHDAPAPALAAALREVPGDASDVASRAIHGEYVLYRPAFDAVYESEPYLIDWPETSAALDGCFEALDRYARGEGPPPEETRIDVPFWEYNRRGELLVAITCSAGATYTPRIDGLREGFAEARATADATLERLRSPG